jgi:hypothetical protein
MGMTTRGGVDFLESYVHMVVVFQPNGANSLFCTNQECDYQVLNFLSEIHIYMIYMKFVSQQLVGLFLSILLMPSLDCLKWVVKLSSGLFRTMV